MRKYIIAFLLPIEIVIFFIFSQNEIWVEKYYIHYVFNNLTIFLRLTLGEIDFSMGLSLFYFLLIILLFKSVKTTLNLIKSRYTLSLFTDLLIKVLTTLCVVFGLYMIMWGLAYHRKPIAKIVIINTENISSKDLKNLCERLIYLTNQSRKNVSDIRFQSYKFRQLFKRAPEGYTQIAKLFPELSYRHSSIKMGFTKGIMSSFRTAGLYFPFTAEANINGNLPFEAPFVICHEMAHQLGFASEEEANYIAYLACVNNPDPEFRYSANYWVLFLAMDALKKADMKSYEALYGKLIRKFF